MKKILFGLAALSAMAFGAETPAETTPSTGVHNSDYGNNQIDVETKALIISSGLVITATPDTSGATDAIKKAILDHGTLMAGPNAESTESKTIYLRRANGNSFPKDTVVNIALNHAQTESEFQNKLMHPDATVSSKDRTTIAHTLNAAVNNSATYSNGSGTNGGQTLTLSGTNVNSNGDFKVTGSNTNNIPITLTSSIARGAVSLETTEGEYKNISTLAVRFSKVPTAVQVGSTEDAGGTETPGIKTDGKPGASALARR